MCFAVKSLAVIALSLVNKCSVMQIIVIIIAPLVKFKLLELARNANQKPETGGNNLETKERLKVIILKNTELKEIADDTVIRDKFFPEILLSYSMENFKNELALGSLDFMALVIDIEEEFDVEISDDQLLQVKTAGDFVLLVESLVSETN